MAVTDGNSQLFSPTTPTTTTSKVPEPPQTRPLQTSNRLDQPLQTVNSQAAASHCSTFFSLHETLGSIPCSIGVTGFKFCPQLNLAVFDADVPLHALVVEAVRHGDDQPFHEQSTSSSPPPSSSSSPSSPFSQSSSSSLRSKQHSLLDQLGLHRHYSRMFSPTLNPGSLEPFSRAFSSRHLFERSDSDGQHSSETRQQNRIASLRKLGHQNFVRLIDTVAQALFEITISKYVLRPNERNRFLDNFVQAPVNSSSAAHRLSCFLAADGHNDWVKLIVGKQITAIC